MIWYTGSFATNSQRAIIEGVAMCVVNGKLITQTRKWCVEYDG